MNDLSSSVTLFKDKRDAGTDHARWCNIKKFVYLAFTFASSSSNFDIFSKVYENVRLFDFLICEVTVGMTYMCMDFFIKQYTRKIDLNHSLNPLLKGITYGNFLQSALWTLLHATDLADALQFLGTSLLREPSWTKCPKTLDVNMSCVPPQDIILRCHENNFTLFSNTSAHKNYVRMFFTLDQNIITTRFFVVAVVWIFTFFCTAGMDDTLIKIFRMSSLFRLYSTITVVILLLCLSKFNAITYFEQILDINAPSSFTVAMDHVAYAYGIGFIGVYDFGTLSPYLMVDNAIMIFTIVFTLSAFARSLIVKILHVVLTSCVEIEISVKPHYLMFAILPLSTEFFYVHKLFIIYIYVNVILATITYLALLTLTLSKLLHSEFRSVRSMYIVGILCFLGFILTVPVIVHTTLTKTKIQGLIYGLNVTVLYLGGFKVAIVMWIYGVQRFTTDIQFWLGFKPTKFWIACWMFLPIVLFSFCAKKVYLLIKMKENDDSSDLMPAVVWIIFSVTIVALIHTKTVLHYLFRNNLARAFTSSPKYGPPDSDDRKQRKAYNETIQQRQCVHNCILIDDTLDCNHLPLLHKNKSKLSTSSGSGTSITSIFQSGYRKRHSTVVDPLE